MLALCRYEPLLQQVSDALHHCSLPGMSMAQVLSQALCRCSPVLPKLLLMAEEVQYIGCLQLEQAQLLVAPSQLACCHVVLESQQLAEAAT